MIRVLLAALLLVVVPAAPASAHAYVVATTPANGSQLSAPPTEIRVTFQEPVTRPTASVLDASGRELAGGPVRLVDGRHTLVIGVRALVKGSYIASWSVVSADTHPVGGSLQFGFGVPAVALPPVLEEPSAAWQLAVGVVKGLLYLGLVLALGLLPATSVLGVERCRVTRAARAGVALAIVASLAQIVVQYRWESAAFPAFAGSEYAVTVYARIALLLVGLVVPLGWGIALGIAVLGTVVHNGHGGDGPLWHFVSTLVHVSAVVGWLGGLAVLGWLVLRQRLTPSLLRRLPLWSRYAAAWVSALALTGLLQSVVQVRHPGALVSTTYGWVLLVKLVLVLVALLLGFFGNRWVVRHRTGVAPGETARLRARVKVEAAVGVVIVVVSGVLSSVAPAAAAYAPHRVFTETIGPYRVRIEVAPARRGPESFRITAVGDPSPVSAQLGLRAGAVRDLAVAFPYRLPGPVRSGAVTFVSSSVNVPTTGDWTGTLTLVAGPTEQYAAAFTYRVL